MPRGTPKTVECDAQVVNQVVCLSVLYNYVINVCLNGPPDVVSEDVLHTSLVCSARISETKRHHHVVEQPKRCDEGSHELVGSLHLYMVVPGIGIKET
jgi:hypothetical protein